MGLLSFRTVFFIVGGLVLSLFVLGAFGPFGLRYDRSPYKCQYGQSFMLDKKIVTYSVGRLQWVVAPYGCEDEYRYDTRTMKPIKGYPSL